MHKPIRTLVSAAVLGVMAAGAAHSAGFALYGESNGAATGNYAAGVAAEAADASTGWYNPAGLVLIQDQQLVLGGVGIFPNIGLSGTSTFTTPGLPSYVQSFGRIASKENSFVPSLHYALPLTDNVAFGFSVVSPYGLATDWLPSSPVRYAATYTELLTTDLSPELAARLSEYLSVGLGLDIEWTRVKFNSMVGAPTADTVLGLGAFYDDSLSYNKGSSWGVGFHGGIMGLFNDKHTRIGLNYQSSIRQTYYGYSRLTGRLATAGAITTTAPGVFYSSGMFSNGIDLPDVLTLSGYQDLNERFALLGSVVYTGWSLFKTIQLNAVAAPAIAGALVTPALVNVSIPQNYSNVWRFSLGANYHLNENLMIRAGAGYDQTPTNDTNRDVRLPDVSRWALAVGARYQLKPTVSVDAGYTHLFGINNNGVNSSEPLGTSTYVVNATSSTSADLVGLQLNWSIDQPVPVQTK